MRHTLIPLLLTASLLLIAGCASPLHLQKDFGTSTQAAFSAQADLNRPAAAELEYPITGVEALRARYKTKKSEAQEAVPVPFLLPTKSQ